MKHLFSLALVFLITFSAFAQKPEVKWMSFEEAVAKTKENPKKLFIDVYTTWCGYCKAMDKNTFSHPAIAKYINENFYPVKLDGEHKEDITLNGHTFKFVESGRRGYHELAASLLNGKLSYPTVVFMDENLRIIQPLPGYRKPAQIDPILKFIGGDHYKNTPWEDFEKNFKSSL